MDVKQQYERIILGLKVKQLRQELNLSFAELSARSKIAVSYLNEIEKGKKFPKPQKLKDLATALKVKVDYLISTKLSKNLEPISFLLESNFLKEIPFDLFGIEIGKVVEILSNAPSKVAAFISTLIELSRNFALEEQHFYLRAMRAYQELHNNYFPEIEAQAIACRVNNGISNLDVLEIKRLEKILTSKFNYNIIYKSFEKHNLSKIRTLFIPSSRTLLINKKLIKRQITFQLAKEIGFNFMKLEVRPLASTFLEINSFEEVLNNFKAGYFAVAFILEKELVYKDFKNLVQSPRVDIHRFTKLLVKYNVAPETLFRRLNTFFQEEKIKDIFFLRMTLDGNNKVSLDKELQLNRQHHPHSIRLNENYCRRWGAVSGLFEFKNSGNNQPLVIKVQKSKIYDTEDQYLVISVVKKGTALRKNLVSVSFGVLIDENSNRLFKFIDDPSIENNIINVTCERCPIVDCKERNAPAAIVMSKQKKQKIIDSVNQLTQEFN